MMWLRALTIISVAALAAGDLMDLYVQHMDEVMRTHEYKRERARTAAAGSQALDIRRHFERRRRRSVLEGPMFRVADSPRQSLHDDFQMKNASHKKKKFSHVKDALDFPTVREDDYDDENTYATAAERREPEKYIEPQVDESTFPAKSARSFPKKYSRERKKVAFALNKRSKRSVGFARYEVLDEDGDVILEWDPTDDENVTFRVTAKTLGYVGLGFNDKSHMMGADIILAWVDDHTMIPTLLDSHGVSSANAAPETDISQDVHLIHGSQNDTHTVITFTRRWRTCDPQDRSLTGDTVRVIWALHSTDPELNAARFHGEKRGGRALRLKAPAPHPPPAVDDPDLFKWDVKLNQFTVSNTSDTIYWCKIFRAPKLNRKHHMIGYSPIIEKANEALVHHVILYECSSTNSILAEHARLAGAHCYSPTMPKEWDSCLQPVLAWARGSRGEWLPEHVGLPIAEHFEHSYYMLEVHYNNKMGRKVIDSSGVRLHLTPNIRKMEAGILVAGVAVSPLHMVPPQQKEYATAGYCTPQCTEKMFDKEGINIVSVVLHSHLAGKQMSLRHIRQGQELAPIVQDKHFDFDYQQSHTLEREVKILPGDEIVAECVYDTRDRTKPTFGGYAAHQEMCLAFVVHYPRTPLAACYSMTPVKEFFNALNVQSFKGVSMEQVEKLFLSTTTDTVALPVSPNHHAQIYPDFRPNDDVDVDIIKQTKSALISKGDYIDYDDIFARLVIEKPDEFKDHTLSDHMLALAWNDTALSKSIEMSLYHGRHVTYCRTREDKIPRAASIQQFPNFTALPEANNTYCKEYRSAFGSSSVTLVPSFIAALLAILMALLH
ncbi:MOXD1 homolog 1 [Phymastichus coffea]|uniref:MOXD1 homolog 1 n=1 Tax=Phymastichus coffea TaxID=108790 RepID=UPI00273B9C3C|nr:MOXD1 homolog 1 [Phymastichus coffea]